jgi:hypothetical protein
MKGFVYVLVVLLVFACFLIFLFFPFSNKPFQNPNQTSTSLKAAIVDQLSISQPNETFVETSRAILTTTSFEVHYFTGENVTVDFYRNLPSYNFDLIIFRVHSTGECSAENAPAWVVFFTGEPYSETKYWSEQLGGQVVSVRFVQEASEKYFGITPFFIRDCMNGKFNDTVIIAMGCDGLKYTSMADAFVQKGAKVFIGWDGPVFAHHTDIATTHLLQCLLTKRLTIAEAITDTRKEVGPDPSSESKLTFTPVSATLYVIPQS